MQISRHDHELHIVGNYKGKSYTLTDPYVISLAPVEQFLSTLESMVGNEQARKERRLVPGTAQLMDLAESMNPDQMRYVVSGLLSQVQL
ncbi:hypothetical protein J4210_05000 [Candidatus Woesearchaeota archaeon]|nr:hypothetical protein [Candidatus Woesearchaeota archaeon]